MFKNLFGKSAPRRVEIEPSGESFDVGSGRTILESALTQGIAYPHDCTVGTCGSCRSRLLSGKVEAITPFSYTLSSDELDAGYILACQALPKSDLVVEVEIADGAPIVATTQPATLIRSEDLTHDIKRVTWRVDTPLHWRAGQYINVHREGSDARSYSFAHAPIAAGHHEVTTFIRHVPGGSFTDVVFKGDPYGVPITLDGPHGNFWLRKSDGPMLCIAGGSGLAPILSLLEDAAMRRTRRDCILLFGARAQRDLYALDEVARIRSAWTAGFDFWPVLSEEDVSNYRHGFVTGQIEAALTKLGEGAQAYLCGPPPMIDAAIPILVAAGVPLGEIHYDKFTDASTSKA